MSLFVSKHVFIANRAYYTKEESIEKTKKLVVDEKGKEYVGAGFTSYGDFVGFILSCIGYASKIKFGETDLYVNNKSFCKFVARCFEMEGDSNSEKSAKRLNELYMNHRKSGYEKNQVSSMEKKLKELVSKGNRDAETVIPALSL